MMILVTTYERKAKVDHKTVIYLLWTWCPLKKDTPRERSKNYSIWITRYRYSSLSYCINLMSQQQDYIQQRSTAIESIESTIAELGSIFGQLAHMVAEQRETVQRIDADTTDIADNISGAQRELLKYYASISSNRWLMIKIFGAIIVVVSDCLFSYGPSLIARPVSTVCSCKLIGQFLLYSPSCFWSCIILYHFNDIKNRIL